MIWANNEDVNALSERICDTPSLIIYGRELVILVIVKSTYLQMVTISCNHLTVTFGA